MASVYTREELNSDETEPKGGPGHFGWPPLLISLGLFVCPRLIDFGSVLGIIQTTRQGFSTTPLLIA